ncbi:MAG: thioredoxin-like domain-containing protein [Bacteroidales bacterium]
MRNRKMSSSNNAGLICTFLFFLLASSYLHTNAQGHEIKVKINNLRDTSIILGHHFASNLLPDDTIRLDKSGTGTFKGKEKLNEGMYFLYLPSRQIFDFLIGNDQVFSLQTDTADMLKQVVVSGSADNELFFTYQRFLSEKRSKQRELQAKMQGLPESPEKEKVRAELQAIDQEVMAEVDRITGQSGNTFFGTFIRATKEIDVPDFPRDKDGVVLDSAFKYRYYRQHYFDNMDYTDGRLLRTPVYEDKFKVYFEKVLPQIPDTLIKELDPLIERARKDPDVFRYVLVTLFNYYAQSQIMGHDGVFIHLAEKYYIPEATWAGADFIKKLKDQITKRKPLLIGQTAPDFQLVNVPSEHFIQAADDTAAASDPYIGSFFNLSQVQARFTVLMFWEADCGHCQKAMPELFEIYKKVKDKGVQVVAVHMLGGIEGKKKWVKFVNDHKFYGWINAWNPYDYKYKEMYDIKSTPVLYLLDENKKIVAKLIPPEAVEEIIDVLIREEERNKNKTTK